MPTPKPKPVDDFVPESVGATLQASDQTLGQTSTQIAEEITEVLDSIEPEKPQKTEVFSDSSNTPIPEWLESQLAQSVAAKMLATYAIKGYPMKTACQIVSGYLAPLMEYLKEHDLKTSLEVEIATAFAIQYSDRGIDPKIATQSIIDALVTAQENLK